MLGQAKGLAGHLLIYPVDFEQDPSWLNNSSPMIYRAFTFSHPGFSRFGADRFIWKQPNPNLPVPFYVASHRTSAGFDLAASNKAAINSLNGQAAEVDLVTGARLAAVAAFLAFPILGFRRHQ